MKYIAVCISLLFSIALSAQKVNEAIPIDSALMKRFYSTNINEVLGIPVGYNVLECQFLFSSKGNLYCATYSAPTKFYTPRFDHFQNFLKAGRKGDRLIFSEMVIMKGDKRLKLASQIYSFQ